MNKKEILKTAQALSDDPWTILLRKLLVSDSHLKAWHYNVKMTKGKLCAKKKSKK